LAALGLGASAQASTIFASLQTSLASDTGGVQTWNVAIYARSSQGDSSPGAGDGGVSGFQFDILSDGHNISAPVPAASVGPNFAKVKTTFAISSADFATQLLPQKIDVGAAQGYPNDTDTDLDAYAGSFADSNSGFTNTTLGKTASGLGALIATEQWTVPDGQQDHLSLFLVGPQYYDFSNTTPGSGSRTNFTTTTIDPAGGTIGTSAGTTPEPAALGFLSVVGIAGFRRRRSA
jgi:MYXO-CTERM domain-containing protein